jgi:hypothetical protein
MLMLVFGRNAMNFSGNLISDEGVCGISLKIILTLAWQ